MRSLIAFTKKELIDQHRSGKLTIICLLFCLFGVMNPAIAKLTPWLLEAMADSLAESGMIVTGVKVTAMESWVQFFKNIPMGLIVFVLLESSIFTKEYGSGTLVLSLTKGLERFKVVVSKTFVLTLLWSAGYWLCFGITYGYNAWFWDNSVAKCLVFSALCWWLFGVMTVLLMVLFSALSTSNIGVLLGCCGVVIVSYLGSMLPKCGKYFPIHLTDGNSLIYGLAKPDEYIPSLLIALGISVGCFAVSILIFNKKSL